MSKLRKRLQKMNVELVPIDAPFPHPDDPHLLRWWDLDPIQNIYQGLEETIQRVQMKWNTSSLFCGLLGFSQGARLGHLLALRHHQDETFLPHLHFVLLVAGYDAKLPNSPLFSSSLTAQDMQPLAQDMQLLASSSIHVPSLHVWGETDQIITPSQSAALCQYYVNPQEHVHEGGHHVPMRAFSVNTYVDFIASSI